MRQGVRHRDDGDPESAADGQTPAVQASPEPAEGAETAIARGEMARAGSGSSRDRRPRGHSAPNGGLSPTALLGLQRLVGNADVCRMLEGDAARVPAPSEATTVCAMPEIHPARLRVSRTKVQTLEGPAYPFQGVTVTPLAGLPDGQVNALTVGDMPLMLHPHIAGFTAHQFAALAPALIGAFLPGQVPAWRPEHLAAITALQAGALTAPQAGALNAGQVAALGARLAHLQPPALANLGPSAVAAFGLPVVNALAVAGVLGYLPHDHLADQVVTGIDGPALQTLARIFGPGQLAKLTDTQVGALTLDTIKALDTAKRLHHLNADHLGEAVVKGIDGPLLQNLARLFGPGQLAKLTDTQVGALTLDTIKALDTAKRLHHLNADHLGEAVVKGIDGPLLQNLARLFGPGQLAKLTDTQVGALSLDTIKALDTAKRLHHLNADHLGEAVVKGIDGPLLQNLARLFGPGQLAKLTDTQVGALSLDTIKALDTAKRLTHLNADHLGVPVVMWVDGPMLQDLARRFGPAQLAKLTEKQVALLSLETVKAVNTAGRIAHLPAHLLSEAVVKGTDGALLQALVPLLTPAQVSKLVKSQVGALSQDTIKAMKAECVGALPAPLIVDLSLDAVAGISDAQARALAPSQIRAIHRRTDQEVDRYRDRGAVRRSTGSADGHPRC